MADDGNSGKSSEASDKPSGGKSLNEQNWPGLLALTAFNLVAFGVVTAIDPTSFSKLATAWAFVLPAGVGLAMIRVINGLINAKTKDRLVFWRWGNPLPGARAFTVYARDDDRFTWDAVVRKLQQLGVDPKELEDPRKQNAYWYRDVFYPVQDRPAVQQAERNFLFTRDYAAISFVMLFALGFAGYLVMASPTNWLLYFIGLIFQYLLVRWAARTYGIEAVRNALAAWLTIRPAASAKPVSEGGQAVLFAIELHEDGR
jgi:hypothetical protein